MPQPLDSPVAHMDFISTRAEGRAPSGTDENRLYADWGRAATPNAIGSTIHEVFERHAVKIPNAIAVRFEGKYLTYNELDHRANQVGRYLINNGCNVEMPIGVCMHRSDDLIVALLAILKIGGCYLALDPEYPRERLAHIIREADCRIIISESHLKKVLSGNARVLLPSCERCEISKLRESAVRTPVFAENLAYISYTSGSTGRPKGVCITHQSVLNLVQDQNYVTFGRDDVFVHHSPLAFDASTFEIWGPLLNGGTLIIAPGRALDVKELLECIRNSCATVLWLTAGLFREIVDTGLASLSAVRELFTGGDVVSVDHFNRVIAELKSTRLVNGYGPTENTTFSCCFGATTEVTSNRVPIGLPINNSRAYILDADLQRTPDGERGELFVAGAGLARGYLGSPAQTASRFLPDPFGQPGDRMYRTGDIVHLAREGWIEFEGRSDDQLKIRGYRVEPREIETALLRHPGVKDVLVGAFTFEGNKRLAAYIVCDSEISVRDLRTCLSVALPDYMLPTDYVLLDRFPLTSRGKVNRGALPQPVVSREQLKAHFQEPVSEKERDLASLWQTVLGVPVVGIDDDFFELGGDSLLAARITSAIANTWGVRVPALRFYLGPTIRQLAKELENLTFQRNAAMRN